MFGLGRKKPSPAGGDTGRVSVAVPLYNHARYIAQAMTSILAQGPIVREIVVIDDGSTDDSAAIMQELVDRDSRIRFERQSNQGAHATINRALSLCDGEFLAILNSDDAWSAERLSQLVAHLDADPEAGFAWSLLGCIDDAGIDMKNVWYDEALAFYRAGAPLGSALLNGNFVMTTSNLLIRRNAWQAVGTFASLRYTHDLDWLLRAIAIGQKPLFVEQDLLRYRIHAQNTIAEDHSGVRCEVAMTAASYLTLLWDDPNKPIDWDQAAATQTVLHKHEFDRAVAPCMAYMRRTGRPSLDHNPILDDQTFRARVKAWV